MITNINSELISLISNQQRVLVRNQFEDPLDLGIVGSLKMNLPFSYKYSIRPCKRNVPKYQSEHFRLLLEHTHTHTQFRSG